MASASEEWKEKRRLVFARLDAKNAERSALRREREADAGESGSQATDAFWASLNVIADGLRADIAAVLSGTLPLDASPAKAVTDGWASQFEAARQCVADGSRGLPPYDAEASQQLLGRLREEIDGARSKVTPKRKFAFGRRRQREQAAAPSPAPAEPSPGAAAPAAAASAALLARLGEEEVTVAGKRGEVVELGAESGAGGASCGDVRLMDMEDCTVVVTRRLSALPDCLSPPKPVEPESDVAAAAPTAGATGAAAAASLAAGHDASAAAASRAAGGDADDDDDEL
ncbi:hypothetical protein FNF27_06160 [Cafeteria roenbergensis]|uniref:Tubulin-specific chaperone C N-terminal domain-containing protein n=1 Tax=Cafeteria roenbergensis TaxID=33653 RepID=A0A5A8E3G8_CAFRO|nr:hypothetical protein FNF27_06160 [Cafeteria roenbergensis]